jgi:hypothetical protein
MAISSSTLYGVRARMYKLLHSFLPSVPSTVAKRLACHFTFGRSRVLTPVPPDQMWVFFRGFSTLSHRGMSHITDKANAGSSTTFLLHPSSPYPSRIFPSVWLKRLWKASAARPPSGGMEDASFFLPFVNTSISLQFLSLCSNIFPISEFHVLARRPLFLFLSLPAFHYEIITDKKLGNANKLTRQFGIYA